MPLTIQQLKEDLAINEASLNSTIDDIRDLVESEPMTPYRKQALQLLHMASNALEEARVYLRDE